MVKAHIVFVGVVISTQLRCSLVEPDKRVASAIGVVDAFISLRTNATSALHAVGSAALLRMLYGTRVVNAIN